MKIQPMWEARFFALGIAFIALKIFGVIDWSWWLVTLPLWFGVAFSLFLIVLALIFSFVVAALTWRGQSENGR